MKHQFGAEVGKILNLVIHSLYTNKDIFLRELISNASDAIDKLRYLAVTDQALLENDSDYKIKIIIDKDNNSLTIADNGIGMNERDLIDNLGTIASSGTQKFFDQLSGDKKKDLQLIGQFGVGFYSAFMVAREVIVTTRKAGEQQGYIWQSAGEGEFTIEEVKGEMARGTSILLKLRDSEYTDKFRIQHIIKTYSDHISVPIMLSEKKDQEGEMVNSSSALWMRPKSEITEEQYEQFYRKVAHQVDKPWLILHNKNEGSVEFTNLLFIPSSKPFDLYHPDRMTRLKLYVKRVFITEEHAKLVPPYLRFLRGIIDSEDLPLNISRETLQYNNVLSKIQKIVINKVISELGKIASNEPQRYQEFWRNFGPVLKEGLCEGGHNRDDLLAICRFKTTKGEMVSLDEYIARMKEGQEYIYFITGEERGDSPQLEGFKKRDIEVLLLSDQVDNFWISVVNDYKDKEFKSVTRADIELEQDEEIKENLDSLTDFIRDTLSDNIKEVRLSSKLTESPVCLAIPEGGMDIKMERFLLEQNQLKVPSLKILEINPKHKIIQDLASKIGNDNLKEENQDLVHLLYDQACVIEGEPLLDPAGFAKRLNKFLSCLS